MVHEEGTFGSGRSGGPGLDGGNGAVAGGSLARRGGFFPAVAGGLIAGAVIGGMASNAYAYGPGYGYYGGGYGHTGITAAATRPAYYGGLLWRRIRAAYYGGGYYGGYLPRGSLSPRDPPGIRLLWRPAVLSVRYCRRLLPSLVILGKMKGPPDWRPFFGATATSMAAISRSWRRWCDRPRSPPRHAHRLRK